MLKNSNITNNLLTQKCSHNEKFLNVLKVLNVSNESIFMLTKVDLEC